MPGVVEAAAAKNEPYLVARAVIDVCSSFNRFYFDCRIMDEDPAVKNARLALTDAARQTIRNGLWMLGIQAPERM